MDAEQGVAAMRAVHPTVVVPVHHEDYDVFTSGLDEFLEEAARAGLSERVVVVGRGERVLVDDAVHARSGLQPEGRSSRRGEQASRRPSLADWRHG